MEHGLMAMQSAIAKAATAEAQNTWTCCLQPVLALVQLLSRASTIGENGQEISPKYIRSQ
jgi:hypothetical protein